MVTPKPVEFPYEVLLLDVLKNLVVDSGTVTTPVSIDGNILTDASKNWATNIHKNRLVKIVSGSGAGQSKAVKGNTDETLVIKGAWAKALDTTSTYVILGEDLILAPIAKAALFNSALPAAEADWLGADITPTNSPSYLRIYACVSVTGVLRVARTIEATTVTEDLNSGTALVAGAAYMFTIPWRVGDGINIRYSVTAGMINRLLIDEIGGAE